MRVQFFFVLLVLQVSWLTVQCTDDANNGAVYFTKALKEGRINEARTASLVTLPNSNVQVKGHSGYITTNEARGDHFFIWYLPNEAKPNSPLLVWLNGGPGLSSLVGLFMEIGPFFVHKNGTVTRREVNWADEYSLLFIDNPIHTGFSYSDSSDTSNALTIDGITNNLYECLVQVPNIFPDVKTKDLYIGGQSYAGVYIPALAHELHTRPNPDLDMKGIYIVSGLISPSKMFPAYPSTFEAMGVIGRHRAQQIRRNMVAAIQDISVNASRGLEGVYVTVFDDMQEIRGFPHAESFIYTENYDWNFNSYLNRSEVQRAIHARQQEYHDVHQDAIEIMAVEFLSDMSAKLAVMMDNYKVLIINGQMDPLVSVLMTNELLYNLDWSGKAELATSLKQIWKDEAGNMAGYSTNVQKLTWVVMSMAGHRVTIDKPEPTLDLMKQFTSNNNDNADNAD